jgi:hypothetical protein
MSYKKAIAICRAAQGACLVEPECPNEYAIAVGKLCDFDDAFTPEVVAEMLELLHEADDGKVDVLWSEDYNTLMRKIGGE